VNALEVEVDERCLALLARWQPVASDLRFVGATLKLVTDLERVGDHCVHLCERVADLPAAPAAPPAALDALVVAVPALLREACAAWRSEDASLAGRVIERAALTHALLREVVRDCLGPSPRAATPIATALCWHELAASLDRIAGHAANVGELVIFLVRGQDVRHLRLSG
jgi:phosphate transport system protein